MLDGYQKRQFTAPLVAAGLVTEDPAVSVKSVNAIHDVYTRGDASATVVIIQELPGIGPETLHLADLFVERGFRVVLPHLFGPLGKISMLGNMARVMCMRREFRLFEKHQSSPIVNWLRALCRDLKDNHGATGIGAIGMCLTGNFAISMMIDDSVMAAVASQPSMPLFDQNSLHMNADEITQVKNKLDTTEPMLALRFAGDKLCTAEKFAAIDSAFNDGKQRIELVELPGPGHSVLTLDLYKRGQPAQDALEKVIDYFSRTLPSTAN